MKTTPLTQKSIHALRTLPRTYTVWDSALPALGVRVCNDGRRFYVERTQHSSKVIAIVDQMSLKQVRQFLILRQGQTQEKTTRIIRFDNMVNNEWLEAVLAKWKPSTQRAAKGSLRRYLMPVFGRYPVHRIDGYHVQRWFDTLSQTYAGAANRTLDVLRTIFAYAVSQGHCNTNPCEGIKPNPKRRLNRFLSIEELSKLSLALHQVSQRSEMDACCAQVLRLILLTGCRVSEVTMLKWSLVKGDEWHLLDSKTGAKVVFVGREAQKLVYQIRKRYPLEPATDEVFPLLAQYVCRKGPVNKTWQQVRVLAGIEDVRIHDLRHTFASYAVLEGYPLPMVAKLLGHKRLASTLRYTHVSDSHVEEQAEKISEVLTQKLEGVSKKTAVLVRPKNRKKPLSKPKRPSPVTSSCTLTDEQIHRIQDDLDFWD